MKRILAGILAIILITSASCQKKASGSGSSPDIQAETTTGPATETPDGTTTDASAETTAVPHSDAFLDEVRKTDSQCILKCVLSNRDEKEIKLTDYTSGTDYVFIIEGYRKIIGSFDREIDPVASSIYEKNGPRLLDVAEDLDLPAEKDGVTIYWYSSDPSLVESTGKVHRPHDHSKYVILTGAFTKGSGYLIERYVLHVARDMYDNFDVENLPPLDYYNDPGLLNSIEDGYWEKLEGTEGGWYLFTIFDQIVFFDTDPNYRSLYDHSNECWTSWLIGGQFSDPRVETMHEAYLNIAGLQDILGYSQEFPELRPGNVDHGLSDIIYDFDQYHDGVKVNGGKIRVISSSLRPYVSINVSILKVPPLLSSTPNYTPEEIMEEHDLHSVELMFWNWEGKTYLTYYGYRNNAFEAVFVDAHSGEEIHSTSTIVT